MISKEERILNSRKHVCQETPVHVLPISSAPSNNKAVFRAHHASGMRPCFSQRRPGWSVLVQQGVLYCLEMAAAHKCGCSVYSTAKGASVGNYHTQNNAPRMCDEDMPACTYSARTERGWYGTFINQSSSTRTGLKELKVPGALRNAYDVALFWEIHMKSKCSK